MSGVEDDGESSNSEMIDVNEDEASDASKKEEWKKERALKLGFYPQKRLRLFHSAGYCMLKTMYLPIKNSYFCF